jgi:hypothetical protein
MDAEQAARGGELFLGNFAMALTFAHAQQSARNWEENVQRMEQAVQEATQDGDSSSSLRQQVTPSTPFGGGDSHMQDIIPSVPIGGGDSRLEERTLSVPLELEDVAPSHPADTVLDDEADIEVGAAHRVSSYRVTILSQSDSIA